MCAPARHEIMIVQYAIILIGDLFQHQILIFGTGHHHQVFQGVV